MPNRIIKESICYSEDIDGLTPEEEIFFYRLMVNCDDYGILDARDSILRSRCFPLKVDSVKEKDIEKWLKSLIKGGLVFTYEVNGRTYLKMTSWEKHQQVRAKRSKYPQPNEQDITCNQMISDDCICPRESLSLSLSLSESLSESLSLSESESNILPNGSSSVQKTDPVKEVIDFYNIHRKNLAEARTMSKGRKGLINARVDAYRIENVKQVILKAEESNFLNGGGPKGWVASGLDWLMRPENFPKVLEGKYDNKKAYSNIPDDKSEDNDPFCEQAIAYFSEKYKECYKVNYMISRDRDGPAMKSLLSVHNLKTIKELIELYFEYEDEYIKNNGRCISLFASSSTIGKCLALKKQKDSYKPTKGGGIDW